MNKLRNWFEQNTGLVVIGAIVLLALAIGIFIWNRQSGDGMPARATQAYFYDVSKKELFAAPISSVPPIAAPSDAGNAAVPKGVRAYVFSYGDCKDKSQLVVGWLEMFTPEGQAKLAAILGKKGSGLGPSAPEDIVNFVGPGERLIASPPGDRWIPAESAEASQIQLEARKPSESGQMPRMCSP